MRELRKASLRLIIITSIIAGCSSAILASTRVGIAGRAAPLAML